MPILTETLRKHFMVYPERAAIHLQEAGKPDLSISWERLIRWSGGYAGEYSQRGIQPGEVVVIILEHSEALIYSFIGAILSGKIPAIMPFLSEKISPERYRADLANLISVTQPAAIVTSSKFEPEIQQAVSKESSVRTIILTKDVSEPRAIEFDSFTGLTCSPESITLLQHSSGTTGLQKGVALSHTALLNQIDAYRTAIHLSPVDVVISWLPLYHDMGLIAGFLLPLLSGVPLVLMSPFDWVRAPQRLFHAVSQYGGTLTWLPNFAYNFCAQKVRERHMEGIDLSSWRALINCSEPVRQESHELFFEKFQKYGLKSSALHTCYAMAENVFGVTQSDIETGPSFEQIDQLEFVQNHKILQAKTDQPSIRLLSSGKPISNTEVRIVDLKGHPMAEREIGEITLKSNSMLTGYFHRQDLTEKAFHQGWYLTGDFGFISKGELFVTGRKKDMIIVGGKNIYPQDIETLVNQVSGVHAGRAVAFGVFDEDQGTEEVIVVAEIDDCSPEQKDHMAKEICELVSKNSAVVLRIVHLVGPKWLLKTSSGKISRSANREKYLKEKNECI